MDKLINQEEHSLENFTIWWKTLFEIKDANIRLHSILQPLRIILKSLNECKISFGI
jgi:hypothetical protein